MFVQIMPLGPVWSGPGGHMLYISLYKENMKKIFLSETTWPKALIFGM